MDFKSFITVIRFASMCGVTRRTVYNWLEHGKAPRHEVMADDRIYFYPDEAKAFAADWKKKHGNTRKGLGSREKAAHT